MADEELSRGGKAAAGLLAKAVAVFVAGAAVSRLLIPYEVAKDVAELKVNVARIMDRLNIPKEPELPPLRTSGQGR